MNELVDGPVTVHVGDALSVLRQLPSESVHCCVTSPAYWGLRDYGATGQLGLEPTPELYVEHLVEVFREVRRVLRRDGTCWLNLGDSYCGYHGNGKVPDDQAPSNKPGYVENMRSSHVGIGGLKNKDLVGIPWMVAFALRADGWWLRRDVIWAKPNPMPESVTDRPTSSHEYLFLLTRAERYYYDADAVREGLSDSTIERWGETPQRRENGSQYQRHSFGREVMKGGQGESTFGGPANGRNLRSVWTIATQPYPDAHFATFPEDLVIPCVKAGTSEHGVCAECGASWERVVERYRTHNGERADDLGAWRNHDPGSPIGAQGDGHWRYAAVSEQKGWRPTCTHDAQPVPATVLDPFAGSGTTLSVARRLGRRAVGIELQADYLPLIKKRVEGSALPLLEIL